MDLTTYLNLEEGEYVYIGFTAGTGNSFQEHDLFNWTIPCKNQMVSVEDKPQKNIPLNNDINVIPNPATESARVLFGLETASVVNLSLVSVLGLNLSQPISNKLLNSGRYDIGLDLSEYPNGVYMIVLQIGNKIINKIIVVLK